MNYDLSEFPDIRLGMDVIFRRPPRIFKRAMSAVRVRVVSTDPLRGEPVELIRSWWVRDELVQHKRKLRS